MQAYFRDSNLACLQIMDTNVSEGYERILKILIYHTAVDKNCTSSNVSHGYKSVLKIQKYLEDTKVSWS